MKTGLYESSPIKRLRRSKAEIETLRVRLRDVLAEDYPMTVRQVFYQMVSRGFVEKTEAAYKNVVVRLLTEMRLANRIPYAWIADNTRWQRKPPTHSSLEQAVRRTAEAYRRSLWDNQAVHVEIWLEKDALAGVLYEKTSEWDVPLMVTRGYSSLTYLYECAEYLAGVGKPAHLYYFGDFDPSGLDIPRNVEARLREFAPGAEIHFERAAVTREQIDLWDLPTRPTKKTDSRSKTFRGESVEVDAIPPARLRELVADCIERHVDRRALEVLRAAEESERESLLILAEGFERYGGF